MRISAKILTATIIAGILAFVADLLMYNALSNTIPNFLLIALMLVVLALFVVPVLYVMSMLSRDSDEEFFFLDGIGPITIGLVVALVVLFLAGMGLEAIYDAERVDFSSPTAYIFLLDESGSMGGNDPYNMRSEAVNTLMQTVANTTPYAVYVFASEAACAKEMTPFSQGAYVSNQSLNNSLGGGTAIRNGLELILTDFQAGKFAMGGTALRVILLSDGESSDMGIFGDKKILNDFRSNGICISTVGLGSDDAATMQKIAKQTGGSYIHIDNAQALAQGFNYAATTSADRDLFSERNIVSAPVLYAILRVLFLTVLGAIVVVMKAAAVGPSDSHWLVMIVGWIAAFVGALLVEILALMSVPLGVGLALYCILIAATPVYELVKQRQTYSTQNYSYTYRDRF